MGTIGGPRRVQVDAPPVGWQVPVAVAAVWAAGMMLLLPAEQGVAAWLFGGGWVWPRGGPSVVVSSVEGFLSGHVGCGLAAAQVPRLPAVGVVWVTVAVGEVLVAAVAVWLLVVWWRYLGPGVRPGLASRGEVEAVLGRSRLRKARRVIRPDLRSEAELADWWR